MSSSTELFSGRTSKTKGQINLTIEYVEAAHFDNMDMAKETGIADISFDGAELSRAAIERVFKDHYPGKREMLLLPEDPERRIAA